MYRKQVARCTVAASPAMKEQMEEEVEEEEVEEEEVEEEEVEEEEVEGEEEEEVEGEKEEGIDKGKEEGSSTEGLTPTAKQVAIQWSSLPAAPEFWVSGPSGQVAGCGTTASKRVWGKMPAAQVGLEPWTLTN